MRLRKHKLPTRIKRVTGHALTGGPRVYGESLHDGLTLAEALASNGSVQAALAESATPVDSFSSSTGFTDQLGDVAVVADILSEAVVHAATLAETVAASDQYSVPAVYEETLADVITVGEGLEVDAGIVPVPELPVHWGGIGGPGPLPSLLGLARGADLAVRVTLDPGTAQGLVVLGAMAQGAVLSVAAPDTRKATVQGDSLDVRITLDAGCAFGVVDWKRYNEEFLLLVA
jgi:hypothetical protein